MQITKDQYVIQKQFQGIQKKLLSFSDLHYCLLQQLFYQKFMKDYWKQIIQVEKKVDGILLPGDFLLYVSKYPDESCIKALQYDLQSLSYALSAPLFLSFGNHDVPLCKDDMLEEKKWNLKYFLDDRANGIYVLDNEQVCVDQMVVTGFSPKRDAYNTTYMPHKALDMAYEEFQKCNFGFDPNYLNILLSHENKFFTYPEVVSKYGDLYEKLTLILGGHLHDGYMPIFFQKLFRSQLKDWGVWENFPPQIDMCRGLFKVSKDSVSDCILNDLQFPTKVDLKKEEAASIINRGVAKYSWFFYGRPGYTVIDVVSGKDDLQNTRGNSRKRVK